GDLRHRAAALHPARSRAREGSRADVLQHARSAGLSDVERGEQGERGVAAGVSPLAARRAHARAAEQRGLVEQDSRSTNMSKRDFLVEIGTEELPPKSLFTLAQAFAEGIDRELSSASIAHGAAKWYATPRRLAVIVRGVADRQPDQVIKRLGPSLANAFNSEGKPTMSALGFAASCGTTVEALEQVDGPKGKVLP